MLKNIWRLGSRKNPFRKLILGNRAALNFLVPKLLFIVLALALSVAGQSVWISLLFGILIVAELTIALLDFRRLVAEGARRGRPLRCAASRFGLSLVWSLVAFVIFAFLPIWLALPLALLWLVMGLVGLVALNLWLLIIDMRAAPVSETAELFEQVRQMHDLDEAVANLEALSLAAKDKNTRQDARFYLGWAETFRGHAAVGRGEWSADEFYQRALRADPCNIAAHAMLAIVEARHGDFELAYNQAFKAVQVFNGEIKRDPVFWNLHQNETGSEYEQNAGLFQLCILLIGMLRQSEQSGATKEMLELDLVRLVTKIPGRSEAELHALLQKKAGGHLGALGVLTAGPYRPPASPIDLLRPALILPRTAEGQQKESAA